MAIIGFPLKRSGLAFVLMSPLLVGLPQPRGSASLPGESTRVASPSQQPDLQSLPLSAQASISAVLGRDDGRYHVSGQGARLHADNPRQGLAAEFTPRGVELRTETARCAMALRGYGYGQALRAVSGAAPEAIANRVEYRRGALTEWYVNGPLGLEQGFTLQAPPGPRPSGELLTLALDVSGDVQPALDANGEGLTLQQADGRAALRYAGLSAHDSTGRGLPAWLEMQGEAPLRLRVDDAGSHYPLIIDPLVQIRTEKAKLRASDGAAKDAFGWSVAISGDTVVVGAHHDDVGGNYDQGSAYVFVEPAGGWSDRRAETAKLTASDGAWMDRFGWSVAISGDTVVVGAPEDSVGGSAYVFVEPAGGWAGDLTENTKLTASDGDYFGASVMISGDTVVVGAPAVTIGGSYGVGAAYVFLKPAGGWAGDLTENAKLTASDGAGAEYFGQVAIGGDTIVVGAPFAHVGGNGSRGSAYVFLEPAGGWAGDLTEDAKLTASDGANGDYFGASVKISGDTVVVGARGHDVGANQEQGSAYVFIEPSDGWAGDLTENAKLTALDGSAGDYFGASVAISGDTLVVGAPNVNQGSAYVFLEPSGGWAGDLTENAKLTASDGANSDHFGKSVAIDGETIVLGAHGGAKQRGSAYVFVRRTRSEERR
jgi:hypothetical protein